MPLFQKLDLNVQSSKNELTKSIHNLSAQEELLNLAYHKLQHLIQSSNSSSCDYALHALEIAVEKVKIALHHVECTVLALEKWNNEVFLSLDGGSDFISTLKSQVLMPEKIEENQTTKSASGNNEESNEPCREREYRYIDNER